MNKGWKMPPALVEQNRARMLAYHRERSIPILAAWKTGAEIPSEYVCKRLLIIEQGEKCSQCGWCERNPVSESIPIELEHKDGNCTNNRYENLCLLCPNCHSLTPYYRALNRGRGMGRPEYKKFNKWRRETHDGEVLVGATGSVPASSSLKERSMSALPRAHLVGAAGLEPASTA